jgi:tRNA threonylcarbamoyladenosine biosynthesis protein TsaE
MKYIATSVEETYKIASEIVKKYVKKYNIVFFLLYGNLGSGKTEFVKGVAEGLGFNKKQIKSPTFVYVTEVFNKKYKLFHIDFYRIEKKFVSDIVHDLLENIDLERKKMVFCFEWADKISYKTKLLLANITHAVIAEIKFKMVSSTERKIVVYEK